jgi:hypothetical protein
MAGDHGQSAAVGGGYQEKISIMSSPSWIPITVLSDYAGGSGENITDL